MRKDVVPVYSSSGSLDPIRHVSRQVAVRFVEAETMESITRGVGSNRELIGLRMKELEKLSSVVSPATITFSESMRNGLSHSKLRGARGRTISIPDSRKEAEGIEPDAIEKSIIKIREYPFEGDKLAVRVAPRAAFA